MRNIVKIVFFLCVVSLSVPAFGGPLDEHPESSGSMYEDSIHLEESDSWRARDILEWFEWNLDDLSIPYVVWLDPTVTGTADFEMSEDFTYREHFERYAQHLGAFHEITHPNFVELTWGSSERVEELRAGMNHEVPPISFFVEEESQLPELWSRVSGIKASYKETGWEWTGRRSRLESTELFKGFDLYEFFEEIDEAQEESDSFESIFTVMTPTTLDEFMAVMAAQFGSAAAQEQGEWSFVPLSEANVQAGLVKLLLAQIENNPYSGGYGRPGQILMRIGKPRLGEILEAFENAEAYYLGALTNILAKIPAPERDAAFIAELTEILPRSPAFLSHSHVPAMIYALADNNYLDAVDILTRYANGDSQVGYVSGDAQIALNNLGFPISRDNLPERVDFSGETDAWRSLPYYATLRGILPYMGALEFLFHRPGKLKVSSVEKNEMGGLTFKGTLPDDAGTWELEIGREQQNKIPIGYSFVCGGLCGGGYAGILTREIDRWAMIYWQGLWVS